MLNEYTQPEEFLADDSFLGWYYKTNPNDMKQWELWIGEDPGRREPVQGAVELLELLRLDEKQPDPFRLPAAENNLLQKITQLQGGRRVSLFLPRMIWTAAASIVLILAGFIIVKSFVNNRPAIKTNFGEIREQKLPDGTDVKLNANSKVSYADAWQDGMDREVWLNGEAFFHVSKTAKKSRFIVHTDHFDVIVTGTQFNVINRNGQSNVMLNEGSVIIRDADGKEISMSPGDFVEFRADQPQKRMVRNDSLLAWKDHRLVFDNTKLTDVVVIIRDHYGINVKLDDDSVGSKTISGMLPNDNLDILLQSIDATNDLEVVRHANEISIRCRQ